MNGPPAVEYTQKMTPESDAAYQGAVRRILRRMPPEVPIFIFFALVAIFFTWPLVIKFRTSMYGIPGDNLATVWSFWWIRHASSFGAKASFSPLVGSPFGTHLAFFTLEPISDLIDRFLLLFLNEVAAYNLMIISSFLLSAITMYYLVKYLTKNRWAALFGGLAFSISNYHILESEMFIRLAQIQWMPLYILVLILFMKKPNWKNGLLLALAGIVVVGTCIHYGLFMAIFTPAFLLGHFAYKRLHARKEVRKGISIRKPALRIDKKTLMLSLLVILILILFFAPFIYRFLNPAQINKWPTSSIPGDVRSKLLDFWGSARSLDYLTPNVANPVLGTISKKVPGVLRSSQYGDTQSIGWVVLALAIFAMIVTRDSFKRKPLLTDHKDSESTRSRENLEIDRPSTESVEKRSIIWGFTVAGIVSFILSMPPYFHIGSMQIPLPSIILRIAPWFRWYNRLSVVAGLCAIVVACYGLSWLLANLKRIPKELIFLPLVALLVFESISTPIFKSFQIGKTPQLYERLSDLPARTGLALYPLFDSANFSTSQYLLYQRVSKKPMLNYSPGKTDGETLRRTVYNPFNPDTPGILQRFGLTYMVYLGTLFENSEGHEKKEISIKNLPSGLKLERKFVSTNIFGDALVFKVTAPKADLVPLYQGNISEPHLDAGRVTVRLVDKQGLIRILNFSGQNETATIEIPVENLSLQQQVGVIQGNKAIWNGYLSAKQSKVLRMPGVPIPKGGTSLTLYAGGSEIPIEASEISIFGFERANLKIGDVKISAQERGP